MRRMKARIMSILLAMVMILSMVPMSAMAMEDNGEAVVYTVKFDSTGGSAVENQKIAVGEKAKEPDDPTRDGFVFSGWYTEKDDAFDFDTPITEDLKLTAKWAENAPAMVEEQPVEDEVQDTETVTLDEQTELVEFAATGAEDTAETDTQDVEAVVVDKKTAEESIAVDVAMPEDVESMDMTEEEIPELAEDETPIPAEEPMNVDASDAMDVLRPSSPKKLRAPLKAPMGEGPSFITTEFPELLRQISYKFDIEYSIGNGNTDDIYTITDVSGTFPPGMGVGVGSLNQWYFVGTPTTIGDFTFTLEIENHTTKQTSQQTYNVKVSAIPIHAFFLNKGRACEFYADAA